MRLYKKLKPLKNKILSPQKAKNSNCVNFSLKNGDERARIIRISVPETA